MWAALLCLTCLVAGVVSGPARASTGEVCPMQGQDCAFHDITRANNVGTWQECAWQCNNHRTCTYWSWHLPDANVEPYGCWLKSGCLIKIPNVEPYGCWLKSG